VVFELEDSVHLILRGIEPEVRAPERRDACTKAL
jgi:hypothetical protein